MKQYNAPEVKIAGKASEIVLGWPGTGIDVVDEVLVPSFEFAPDGK
jgi:hypothetical protein